MSLHAALLERFAAPEWAIFFEVANATGYGSRRRYADAVAINLWPSRGMEVVGVEVKASRSDWTREMKDPAKSSEIQAYCDRWYLAVTDGDIIKPGELPPTWGLMKINHVGKLVTVTEAPKLRAKALDKGFIVALVRRAAEAQEHEANKRVEALLVGERAQLAAREKEREKRLQDTIQRERQRTDDFHKSIRDFEDASGVRLDLYGHGGARLGAAVKMVLEETAARQLERLNVCVAGAARELYNLQRIKAQLEVDLLGTREVEMKENGDQHG